ncbi:MAG: hypothetical protein JWN70_2888 [Planctomycetaceae bacterium]|nr:hypothetical protein [Planctomycetaceae bacterium]
MGNEPLPTERDFNPLGDNVDDQHAWKAFGGLTLDQARAKFLENPQYYQEDFMFMGGKAFAYYFPVIEEYLKSAPDGCNDDDSDGDHEAWILSHCIKQHFEGADLPHVRHLIPRVIALADFVQGNIGRFGYYEQERKRVADAWNELIQHVIAIA